MVHQFCNASSLLFAFWTFAYHSRYSIQITLEVGYIQVQKTNYELCISTEKWINENVSLRCVWAIIAHHSENYTLENLRNTVYKQIIVHICAYLQKIFHENVSYRCVWAMAAPCFFDYFPLTSIERDGLSH